MASVTRGASEAEGCGELPARPSPRWRRVAPPPTAAKPFTVEVDPERRRPADVPRLVGDASAFRTATGWEPRIDFHRTIVDLLAWWRERVRSPAAPRGMGA